MQGAELGGSQFSLAPAGVNDTVALPAVSCTVCKIEQF